MMVKGFILGSSLLTLVFFFLWRLASFGEPQKIIFGVISFVLWLLLVILVFIDVKKNSNRFIWVAFTFFTGWFGALIYSIFVKANEVDKVQVKKHSKDNFKAAAIFNFCIGGILFLIMLLTLRRISYVTLVFLVLVLIFFFMGRYLWKK